MQFLAADQAVRYGNFAVRKRDSFSAARGAQYTSHLAGLWRRLDEYVAAQPFFGSGRPDDNAAAEALFAAVKKGERCRKDYTAETDFERGADCCTECSDCKRPHRALKN